MKKTRSLGKALGYGLLALVTAPVWVPVAAAGFLIGYGAYQGGRAVVNHPGKILAGAGLCAALWYAGCVPEDFTKKVKVAVVEGIEYHEQKKEEIFNIQADSPVYTSDHTFYYVKTGDSLSHIANMVSGDSSLYGKIAAANEMGDPSQLIAGQLLKIPKELVRNPDADVYTSVPNLERVVLEGTLKISDRFGDFTQDVLQLNNTLGLDYQDEFPHKNGERVVWYTREHTGLKTEEAPTTR